MSTRLTRHRAPWRTTLGHVVIAAPGGETTTVGGAAADVWLALERPMDMADLIYACADGAERRSEIEQVIRLLVDAGLVQGP